MGLVVESAESSIPARSEGGFFAEKFADKVEESDAVSVVVLESSGVGVAWAAVGDEFNEVGAGVGVIVVVTSVVEWTEPVVLGRFKFSVTSRPA